MIKFLTEYEKEVILKDAEIKEWENSLAYYGSFVDKHLEL